MGGNSELLCLKPCLVGYLMMLAYTVIPDIFSAVCISVYGRVH